MSVSTIINAADVTMEDSLLLRKIAECGLEINNSIFRYHKETKYLVINNIDKINDALYNIPYTQRFSTPLHFLLYYTDRYLINIFIGENRFRTKTITITIFSNDDRHIVTINSLIAEEIKNIIITCGYCRFKYFYESNGIIRDTDTSVTLNEKILNESYPYITNLDEYIDNYINSTSTVLLLLGPPGTGKTRLIRYILQKISNYIDAINERSNNLTVLYSNSHEVAERDNIYTEFITASNSCALVLEDLDNQLINRNQGNDTMIKLLGAADGLIPAENIRKILLSTNILSSNHIDSALLRPGRCYDVINTRKLYSDECQRFLNKFDMSYENISDQTLAELYKYVNEGKYE